ncbi:Aliphatic amidase expression-regulating protein [Aquisphaera giovannonii]|uniref:Aliphatic amidase expression-regulating protein n=1 Tax=Aquisphaera giovannonii TaxID=406548 RepID=A0A5B9W5S6_9BACT|nr:urea ABC transporter substrate-binding protein [Aquisphaera giovannonii]QEH35489.1 Aliphatic amidase expression-regulating protein [Aquisphaera giovannonii]
MSGAAVELDGKASIIRRETILTRTSIHNGGSTRRDHLKEWGRGLALTATNAVAPIVLTGCIPTVSRLPTVKVGILHSQTGTMSISETSLRDAELLAIEDINATGGVLGRQIDPVVEDGRSRFTTVFPKKARKLLSEDKVAVVFGCWTSASRKAVLPVFEELNGLLFYPVQYEGNESSRNIVYTGSVPNQQILPAVDWLMTEAGGSRKRFYLLGSDYVFPRTANFIIKKYLKSRGFDVAGEGYTPLGQRDFKQAIEQIRKADPDVIVSTVNGDGNVGFYGELAAQGITADKVPVVATSVGEDELRSILPSHVKGHLAAWSYYQSVGTPRNRAFVGRFQREFGYDRVTDDPIEAAHSQVYLWKLAVEKAGSFDVKSVLDALRSGIEFEAPGGKAKIDPRTQHTYKRFRLGRVRDDRQFDVVHESADWIAPEPYPQVAFPGWHCDWTQGGLTKGAVVDINS